MNFHVIFNTTFTRLSSLASAAWCYATEPSEMSAANKIVSNVTRNGIYFQRTKSPIRRNAQCWSNFVGHSVHKMPVVNKKFMFQRVYDSLPTSVFERVGVLRELLCVRNGYCSQTLLSVDEMDFIVQFLCLQ